MSLAVVALMTAMVMQLAARRHELASARQLSTGVLLLALGLQLASQMMWNAATFLPLRPYARELRFWELYMVRMGGFIVGGLVPVAGNFGVRMAYLRRHGVSYAQFTWATLVVNVVGLFAGGVLGVGGLAVLLVSTQGQVDATVIGLVAAVFAAGVAAMLVMWWLPRFSRMPFAARWSMVLDAGISGLRGHAIGRVLIFSLLRHLFLFASFGLLYQRLSGVPSAFLAGGLVYAISTPLRILMITPGSNLGLDEWVLAVVGKSLSFDVTTGLLVGLCSRALMVAGQIIGVAVCGGAMALSGRRTFGRLRETLRQQ